MVISSLFRCTVLVNQYRMTVYLLCSRSNFETVLRIQREGVGAENKAEKPQKRRLGLVWNKSNWDFLEHCDSKKHWFPVNYCKILFWRRLESCKDLHDEFVHVPSSWILWNYMHMHKPFRDLGIWTFGTEFVF